MNELPKEEVVVTYDYRDEQGNLLYQVQRTNHKNFWYRRQDSKGVWVNNIQGVRRVLYRFPELLAADPIEPVFVPEGEKDVDNVREGLGLIATTNPLGAATGNAKNKWRAEYSEVLRGRHVVILADNDPEGRNHAHNVAQAVHGIAVNVKIIFLPDLPHKGDVSDWIDKGGTKEQLLELAKIVPEWKLGDYRQEETKKKAIKKSATEQAQLIEINEEDKGKNSQADLLVELLNDLDFFHTAEQESFATIQINNHSENHQLNSPSFKAYAMRRFYDRYKKTPHPQAIQSALGVLEGKALYEGPERKVFTRIAGQDNKLYIDLGNKNYDVAVVSPAGWEIRQDIAIRFRRPPGMTSLLTPMPDGDINELFRFLNIDTAQDRLLILTWLLSAFNPTGPYPILMLHGEHGTAKSTTVRILRSLIDPNEAPLRGLPSNDRDLMIAAKNSWCLSLDNLSFVKNEMSDALCRLATGGGLSTRKLWTNEGEQIFNTKRPVIMNGISELGTRPDLLDRSIVLYLPRIPKDKRRSEKEFMNDFLVAYPRILGAIFSTLTVILKEFSNVQLPYLPRMADSIIWATAAEPFLKIPPGSFLNAYQNNIDELKHLAIESSTVAPVIRDYIENNGDWEGNATNFLKALDEFLGFTDEGKAVKKQRTWPDNAIKLGSALRRIAPSLSVIGIDVETYRKSDTSRERMIIVRKIESAPVQLVQYVQSPDRTAMDNLDTIASPF